MMPAIRVPLLTVFGRSLLLVFFEVVTNGVCLAIAAHSRQIIGLAILSWTIGLRHALDADHIRLFLIDFMHSNAALIISTSIYNKLGGVGDVGSIIGTAISGSFLFIVGLVNSVILCKILRRRRQARHRLDSEHGETRPEPAPKENMLMMRLLGPLVNFVDRPWKMYPVGVLFGLGFDTASSVALLAISALATRSRNNTRLTPSEVIILPFLFTAGMTLVDSLDSVMMMYSYTGFAGHSWKIFESSSPLKRGDAQSLNTHGQSSLAEEAKPTMTNEAVSVEQSERTNETRSKTTAEVGRDGKGDAVRLTGCDRAMSVERSTMSALSITLTTMSVLLAFSMSLIEIMGLIGENCGRCKAAASASDGGGLAGNWWRFWDEASDDYGYIGAGIVGMFVVVVCGWYIAKRLAKCFRSRF